MIFRETIAQLAEHRNLSPERAGEIMGSIMEGRATPAQVAAVLTALRMKGETPEEIAAFAKVMRRHAVTVAPVTGKTLVDTCGTGGDGMHTFNISTASAFVVAGAGIPVVKHGNRSVSSSCGSADVLSELGVNLAVDPKILAGIVERVGIAFFFAPSHHPAMRHVMPVRQELGLRTVFNILGPLTNPAGAGAQVLGVYDPRLTGTLAEVLRLLGLSRAMVVHGAGLDEITTTGETLITELNGGSLRTYTLDCSTYHIPPADIADIRGGTMAENAAIIREILGGEKGACRDIVLLNAAAAIYVGGQAGSLREGIEQAEHALDSGRARERLDSLVEATRSAV